MTLKLTNLDAAQSLFFERELETVYQTTYDIVYPQLKARQFCPVMGEADPGDTSVVYQQFDRTGKAKFVGNNAKDLPRANVFGTEFPRPVREVGMSYGYTWKEVQSAAKTGRSLSTRLAAATRRAIEELLDETATFGAPDYGIASGFVNDPNVTIESATGNWSALTADQIIADVSTMDTGIITDSLDAEKATTLLLPASEYARVRSLRLGGTNVNLLSYMEDEFQIQVFPWSKLETAGVGSVKRAVLYDLSPMKLGQEIPQEFLQLPVQEQGLEYLIPCVASTAGAAVMYPISMRYMDGI